MSQATANGARGKKSAFSRTLKTIVQEYQVYLLLLPTLAYFVIFCYAPMYGAQIAFKDFTPVKGILGSPWVGFKHFVRFFENPYFWEILRNTFFISLYSLVAGFPLPILFAIMLNYQKTLWFKKCVQTVSFAPHFISTVVIVGMLKLFTSPSSGVFNEIIKLFGGQPVHFLAEPGMFYSIYVWSGIWQSFGWGAIIYIGALAGINPELHEAAIVDGASVIRRIWHVDIPGIAPTIITLLIMNTGSILSVGYEKIYLMQNSLNSSMSEVISTYVYKQGLVKSQYSFSSAVGLFNSLVNFTFLVIVNAISRKVSETSLF